MITPRTIVIGGVSAFIILAGACVGVHLKPIMGKIRAATAPAPPARSAFVPAAVAVQNQIDAELSASEPVFGPGGAGLTPEGQRRLDALYPLLMRHAELPILILGYGDAPSAETPELARRRAESIRAYLIFHGISRRRITAEGRAAPSREDVPGAGFTLHVSEHRGE